MIGIGNSIFVSITQLRIKKIVLNGRHIPKINSALKSFDQFNFIKDSSWSKSLDLVKIIIEICRECRCGAGNGN